MHPALKSRFASFIDDPQFEQLTRWNHMAIINRCLDAHRSRQVGTTLVIHDKDPDGYCSAALFRYGAELLKTPNVVYVPIAHGKAFQNYVPPDTSYEAIVVLDHAVPEDKKQALQSLTDALIVFDHHTESSEGYLFNDPPGKLYLGIVNKDYSTTALVYAWLTQLWAEGNLIQPQGGQAIALMVDHYDKWRFGTDLEYDEKVHAFIGLVFLKGLDAIPWDRLAETTSPTPTLLVDLITEGRELKVVQDLQIENICKRYTTFGACLFNEQPRTFAVVFHADLFDRIASRLMDLNPTIDFVVIVALRKTNTPVKLYLRSRDDRMDVQELAAFLGGGGHRNSSGVELSFTQLPALLAQLNVAI